MIVALSVGIIGAAWILLLRDVAPVPTWFFVLAWYPTLVVLDRVSCAVGGGESLFRRPLRVLSLLGWSAVIWLVFEGFNFRLRNWYYVFLPDHGVERWVGILVSFATVVPALLLAERVLAGLGIGRSWRGAPSRAGNRSLHVAVALGAAMATLAILAPRTFFPLVWGALWLLIDPFVFRSRPQWSLLGDITRGEWGRIGRLMIGGVGVGILWEFFNAWARGKWIYTVPWLEQTKLFEMPPLGFLGFGFFALEAWAMYHALCVLGIAVPPDTASATRKVNRRAGFAALAGAAVFAVATLAGMERWTISSTTPRVASLPGITPTETARLTSGGFSSPFSMSRTHPDTMAERTGIDTARARALVASARVSTLRGIGTEHATVLQTIGVRSICALARQSPATLWHRYREAQATDEMTSGPLRAARPTPAEVRVWVGAARRTCVAAGPTEVQGQGATDG
jgi:hypothetical protein